MSRSKKEKEKLILQEASDWEEGRAGRASRRASEKVERDLDRKLGLQLISLRLPVHAIEELKKRATIQGIGYQPYIRQLIMKHLAERLGNPSLEDRVKRLEEKILKSG